MPHEENPTLPARLVTPLAPARAATASEALNTLAIQVAHHPDQRHWTTAEVVDLLHRAAQVMANAEEVAARG